MRERSNAEVLSEIVEYFVGGITPRDLMPILERARAALSACPSGTEVARDERQRDIAEWAAATFGADQASSVPQRGVRLLEEAIEAYQAAGAERDMAHKLVDFVFDRPCGALAQELGGVALTLLCLAQAAGVSAESAELSEIARVKAKPLEHFAARNQAKNDAGFYALQASDVAQAVRQERERAIEECAQIAAPAERFKHALTTEEYSTRKAIAGLIRNLLRDRSHEGNKG